MKENLPNAKTLKALREIANYSQESFAGQIGVSRQAVYLYEQGQKTPGFDKAIAMAKILGVSLKTLAVSLGHDVTGIPNDIED